MSREHLEILDPLHYPRWDEFLLKQPDYSFFHSAPWAKVLSETYRYRPLYFGRIERGGLSVLIPVMEVRSLLTGKRGVGLPFTDYCEPVLREEKECPEVMNELVRFGKKNGWESLEIRSGNGAFSEFPASSSYSVHTLDLRPGPEALFRNLRDTTRRNIKKSIREGVTVSLETSPESVAAFYRLNCLTRRDHGLPPQPGTFFKKIHEHVISRKLGFIVLARHGGREIAGAVYFHSREKTIYKYGASLRAAQHLRANNLVMWRAIQWCSHNGYSSFCFGRTELEHTGLRHFKAGWGGREKIIDYYKYDMNKDLFTESNSWGAGMPRAIWKHVPLPLSKIAGRILYRHVG
jgi:hypothetical protein